MKRSDVTPAMVARMSPVDAALFEEKTFVTEHAEPAIPRLEREEHGVFENWLLSHGYAYRHSRTDKATRERCGAPDFTVYGKAAPQQQLFKPMIANCLAIEFKLPGRKLSKAQEVWARDYGGIVHVLATRRGDQAGKKRIRRIRQDRRRGSFSLCPEPEYWCRGSFTSCREPESYVPGGSFTSLPGARRAENYVPDPECLGFLMPPGGWRKKRTRPEFRPCHDSGRLVKARPGAS